jgi:CoA:oxalate CoA-transferase
MESVDEPMGMDTAMKPLSGVRVLDMSRVLAGPFSGRILSDLGAEVVKVEPPEGDVTRFWGVSRAGLAGYYTQQNVGKRNVCIDLQAEGGPDLVRLLAAEADVLIENFRPGVMARYGLAWDDLRQVNPKLVMLSISGFGQDGPESHRAAYAPILHAETGWLRRSAEWDDRPVTDLALSAADTNASLHGTIGVLSALRVADLTGVGQHIDMCMLDSFLATDDSSHTGLDGIPYSAAGGLVWDGTEGPVLTAGDFRWIWKRLHEVHGLVDPAPAGADVETKRQQRTVAINEFLSSFETRGEMIDALDAANLAWGDVRNTADAFESPTALHRGTAVEIDARDGGTRRVTQTPYRFSMSESGLEPGAVAPHRGEHNSEVLTEWLGAGASEASALSDSGVLLESAEAGNQD